MLNFLKKMNYVLRFAKILSAVCKINYEMQLEYITPKLLARKGYEQYLIFGCMNLDC